MTKSHSRAAAETGAANSSTTATKSVKAKSIKAKSTAAKSKSPATQAGQPKLAITLMKSSYGCLPKHKATLKGLGGLRKIRQTVVLVDTPCVQGMINQVSHMLKVEKAYDAS